MKKEEKDKAQRYAHPQSPRGTFNQRTQPDDAGADSAATREPEGKAKVTILYWAMELSDKTRHSTMLSRCLLNIPVHI